MRKILFLCNTHMQFILATIMKIQQFEDDYVTLIMGSTVGLKDLVETRKSTLLKYYNEVFWSDYNGLLEYGVNHPLAAHKKLIEEFGKDFSDYDDIFFHNRGGAFEMIYKIAYIKRNGPRIHHLEEGHNIYTEGDYYLSRADLVSDSRKNKLAKILFYKNIDFNNINCDIYAVDEKLVSNKIKRKIVPVLQEPVPTSIKESILECYGADRNTIPEIHEKFLFMGECFDGPMSNSVEYYSEIINTIAEKVGYDNLIYKCHPRAPMKIADERLHTMKVNIPFEIYEMLYGLEGKVIINSLSGSAIGIKYLLNSKAKVIFMYPMFWKNYLHGIPKEKGMTFLSKLKKLYEGIYIVENKEELLKCLSNTVEGQETT